MKPHAPLIHHVYFTCGRHFPLILRSIRSLAALRASQTGEIYIYVDREDPFTRMQVDQIHASSTRINLCDSARVTGWGMRTINTEIQCLREVAAQNHPDSYVARTDSDVIFISPKVFRELVGSGADLAGVAMRCCQPYVFMADGCTFFRVKLAREFTEVDEAFCAEVLALLNNKETVSRNGGTVDSAPDDAALFHLASQRTQRVIFLTNYRSSILHFFYDKNEMLLYDHKVLFFLKHKYAPMFRRVAGNALRAISTPRLVKG